MHSKRSNWASNFGFILAAAGSAIGLGNIWKFPGKVGMYGGGTFLLCYILVIILIGFPVMLAELSIGRSTQKNVVGAFKELNPKWRFCGWIGIITLFVILSYYCIVGGWVMKYTGTYLLGANFGTGEDAYTNYFVNFISDPVAPLIWGFVFLVLCVYVVVKGVSSGIEKVSKVLMPILFILLIGLVGYSVTRPGAMEGVKYMFTIDFKSLTAKSLATTFIGALGQAFFSLSVGMGIMVTYGSYVNKKENLVKSAGWICGLDTFVAFMSAIAIIPVVMITGGKDALKAGGGFAFMALPKMFADLPGGTIFGFVFFALLFLAALTSAISVLESCVAFVTEEFKMSRLKASILITVPMSLLSVGYSLSQAGDTKIKLPWFDFANKLQMIPMNAVMEKFTDNLMIPIGAFFFCIFVGWIWSTKKASKEITGTPNGLGVMYHPWSFIVKFLAPAVILVILFVTIGLGTGIS